MNFLHLLLLKPIKQRIIFLYLNIFLVNFLINLKLETVPLMLLVIMNLEDSVKNILN